MILTEGFWVTVAFLGLSFALYKTAKSFLRDTLDTRVQRIESELESAANLEQEAKDALEISKREYVQAIEDAKFIVQKAKEESETVIVEAKKRIMHILKHADDVINEHRIQQQCQALERFKGDVLASLLMKVEKELLENLSKDDQVKILSNNKKLFKKLLH